MSENAITLLSNEKMLDTFKQNAFNHAMNFDLPNILPLYESLYTKLCNI
jgi:L-malate glycosyltransferase